jgi:hypothetical protein
MAAAVAALNKATLDCRFRLSTIYCGATPVAGRTTVNGGSVGGSVAREAVPQNSGGGGSGHQRFLRHDLLFATRRPFSAVLPGSGRTTLNGG